MDKMVKREWTTPRVQKYGTFEEATQYCDKQLGASDGYTFQGSPITCAS